MPALFQDFGEQINNDIIPTPTYEELLPSPCVNLDILPFLVFQWFTMPGAPPLLRQCEEKGNGEDGKEEKKIKTRQKHCEIKVIYCDPPISPRLLLLLKE